MVVERRSWDGKGRREKEREKGREGASVAVEIEILQERHCKAASIDKHPNLWQARLHVHSLLAITHDSPARSLLELTVSRALYNDLPALTSSGQYRNVRARVAASLSRNKITDRTS